MAFTVNDFQDLVRLLAGNPEWRAQLRPLVLGDEFDRLPGIVEELAEAQRRTEVRVEELAEAQRRTEARVEELAEAQRRTEARVEELAEAQRRTEARVEELTGRFDELVLRLDALTVKVDKLATAVEMLSTQWAEDTGALYELRFERKAPSLFGEWLRKPRAISLNDLDRVDEAEDAGTLSAFDARQLRALDVIIQGFDKREAGYPETLFAVEVSRTLDETDLDRAENRAALLTRAGYRAFPAVGGKFAPPRVVDLARQRGILLRLIDQLN
ncbi:MAG: hypothetical protein U0837_17355 [Dehalococcoidia bacterium]